MGTIDVLKDLVGARDAKTGKGSALINYSLQELQGKELPSAADALKGMLDQQTDGLLAQNKGDASAAFSLNFKQRSNFVQKDRDGLFVILNANTSLSGITPKIVSEMALKMTAAYREKRKQENNELTDAQVKTLYEQSYTELVSKHTHLFQVMGTNVSQKLDLRLQMTEDEFGTPHVNLAFAQMKLAHSQSVELPIGSIDLAAGQLPVSINLSGSRETSENIAQRAFDNGFMGFYMFLKGTYSNQTNPDEQTTGVSLLKAFQTAKTQQDYQAALSNFKQHGMDQAIFVPGVLDLLSEVSSVYQGKSNGRSIVSRGLRPNAAGDFSQETMDRDLYETALSSPLKREAQITSLRSPGLKTADAAQLAKIVEQAKAADLGSDPNKLQEWLLNDTNGPLVMKALYETMASWKSLNGYEGAHNERFPFTVFSSQFESLQQNEWRKKLLSDPDNPEHVAQVLALGGDLLKSVGGVRSVPKLVKNTVMKTPGAIKTGTKVVANALINSLNGDLPSK
jgi:hypothetical protein